MCDLGTYFCPVQGPVQEGFGQSENLSEKSCGMQSFGQP